MAESEEYFPRGGKKPNTTYFKQSGNFLGAPEKGEKKKKHKKKSDEDDGHLSEDRPQHAYYSEKSCSARLSLKTVKEGMTVLGRVTLLRETKILISLPGNINGMVMACHISEPYNQILEAYVNDQAEKIKEIPDMFRPGQYVAVKVLEVEGNKLMLSTMPQHLNGNWTSTDLVKGDILQAAVCSEEDHGYVMDIGIDETKAFLNKNKTNPELDLSPGVVTWVCVRSVDVAAGGAFSIVKLSAELAVLRDAAPRRAAPRALLPATKLNFLVDTPLDNGIEGHVLGDTKAYIQRQHIDKVKGKKPAIGQRIQARVMYATQPGNTPFLTMREIFASTYPDIDEEQKIKEGALIDDAQVVRVAGRCVLMRLGGGCEGVLYTRHLRASADLDDLDLVARAYPVGSKHAVRVVSYSVCERQYLVSDQPEVLRQRYFSLRQLAPGDLVDGVVSGVAETSIVVALDRLKGFVHQTQLMDAGLVVGAKKASRSRLTKKFRVGQEVRARVLAVDLPMQNLFLTLKPSLLAEDLDVLKSIADAKVGKAYTGFIKIMRSYIIVSFFNNLVAYVPQKYISREPVENLAEIFHLGQIVTCTILWVDLENKKMTASLITPPFYQADKEEHRSKRKQMSDDVDEVPSKKVKQCYEAVNSMKKKKVSESEENENEQQEVEVKKKKDKKQKSDSNNTHEHEEHEEKTKKKKKKKEIVEEEGKLTEDRDAIETDIHEGEDQVLTPLDQHLIDISGIVDQKKCKKRILSLIKAVKIRMIRIDRIDEKILRIEDKGLDAKNKKFHTAMHTEKLILQERVMKLIEGLKKAQEKLKELGFDPNTDPVALRRKRKAEKLKAKYSETHEHEHVDKNGHVDEIGHADTVKHIYENGHIDIDEADVKEESKKRKKKKNEKKSVEEPEIDIKDFKDLEPVLDIPSAKDFWSANTENSLNGVQEDSSSSSDEEEAEKPKKKRKKLSVAEKQAKAREEEARVRDLEQRAVGGAAQPRSTDQFERALLADPNCSQLWIAYMAFHLQATEVDKARAVGRRALSAICFREEAERLNVWLALLNCEARFGTQESMQKVLEEALQMNDPFAVHTSLLDILVETGRPQEALALAELVARKYRLAEAYTRAGQACFRLGMVDRARHIMQRAITVLDKKEHVAVLVRFAGLERAAGHRERAEALYERVLAVYPRRVDVAAAYVDALRAAGDAAQLRQVMERLTSQKLPARKMKVLYRKWIDAEEQMGESDKVEEIRQRAMEYIDKAKY